MDKEDLVLVIGLDAHRAERRPETTPDDARKVDFMRRRVGLLTPELLYLQPELATEENEQEQYDKAASIHGVVVDHDIQPADITDAVFERPVLVDVSAPVEPTPVYLSAVASPPRPRLYGVEGGAA